MQHWLHQQWRPQPTGPSPATRPTESNCFFFKALWGDSGAWVGLEQPSQVYGDQVASEGCPGISAELRAAFPMPRSLFSPRQTARTSPCDDHTRHTLEFDERRPKTSEWEMGEQRGATLCTMASHSLGPWRGRMPGPRLSAEPQGWRRPPALAPLVMATRQDLPDRGGGGGGGPGSPQRLQLAGPVWTRRSGGQPESQSNRLSGAALTEHSKNYFLL